MPRTTTQTQHNDRRERAPRFPGLDRMERESNDLTALFERCADAADPADLIEF